MSVALTKEQDLVISSPTFTVSLISKQCHLFRGNTRVYLQTDPEVASKSERDYIGENLAWAHRFNICLGYVLKAWLKAEFVQ